MLFETCKQSLAQLAPRFGQTFDLTKVFNFKIRLTRVCLNNERRELGTIKARPTSRHGMGHVDVRWHSAIGTQLAGDDRAERREQLVGWNRMLAIRKRSTTASHYIVVARHMTVIGMAVATNDGELFRNPCALAAVLAEKDTGSCSRDRLEWTANFHRSVRFGIEHVLMRRAAF